MNFTVEEENLICIFDVSNRDILIKEIRAALHSFSDSELREIAESALKKLSVATDTEFYAHIFSPSYYMTKKWRNRQYEQNDSLLEWRALMRLLQKTLTNMSRTLTIVLSLTS